MIKKDRAWETGNLLFSRNENFRNIPFRKKIKFNYKNVSMISFLTSFYYMLFYYMLFEYIYIYMYVCKTKR